MLPFEKARRESEQLLVSADPTIAAGELPETKEWVGDDEIDGRLFEDTEDLDDSEFAEEEDPAIAEAEAKTIEEGDSGTVRHGEAKRDDITSNLEASSLHFPSKPVVRSAAGDRNADSV